MEKPTVAVIFGGRSAEHDVSIVTGIGSVYKPLKLSNQYEPIPVYIAKDGRWFSSPELADITTFTSGRIEQLMERLKPMDFSFDNGFSLIHPGLIGGKETKVDIAFPAMHGTYGEDGSLMGMLRMAGIPFVGCDMAASAVAMDKVLCKMVTSSAGLPSVKYEWFYKSEFLADPDPIMKRVKKLRYPLFVKPAHLGSSIGISKVNDDSELANGIEVALHYDDKVLVEEGVQNLVEVTVPVMGNQDVKVAMVEESLQSKEGFFDFETKYIGQGKKGAGKGKKGGSESTVSRIPAKVSKEIYARCEDLARGTFRAIGGSGTARIDLLIDSKAGNVYVNEVNTLPGFLYNHNWKKAGVSNVELVTKLVDLALERHHQQEALTTTFDTNYLKQF